MALRKSVQADCRAPAVGSVNGVSAVPSRGEYVVVSAAKLAVNDVVEMIPWPAGHRLVQLFAYGDQADSNGAPTFAVDVGILTGEWGQNTVDNDGTTARTCNQLFGAGLTTIGRAAHRVDVTTAAGMNTAASNKDRSIGFKVTGTTATAVVGAKLGMVAVFDPVPVGMASGS